MLLKKFYLIISIFFAVLVVVLTVGVQKANVQQPNDLIFYEGNGCSQDIVFTYSSYRSADDNCKKNGSCKGNNDEARSLRVLRTAKPGSQIQVFDSPSGDQDDDYAIINVLDPTKFEENGLCLRTFQEERNDIDKGITLDYVPKNGLDGKISRVRVVAPDPQGQSSSAVNSQPQLEKDLYTSIFEKSSGPPWVARHGQNSEQYQSTVNDLVSKGYRLVDVSGYSVGGKDLYASIFEKSSGPPWVARHGQNSEQYQSTVNDLVSKGYRLVDVSGYSVGGKDLYASIFEKSSGPPWVARHGQNSEQYQSTVNDLVSKGYRLVDVSGYSVGGKDLYASIFEKSSGPPWVARHGQNSEQYQSTVNDLVSKGYRLVDVSGYSVGGKDLYASIFEKSSGPPWVARHGQNSEQYQSTVNDLVSKGYRLINVSGYSVP